MLNYLIRRVFYMAPIVLGVMFLTFVLFFMIQSPRAMALRILGPKASSQAVETWLRHRGYDRPMFINTQSTGPWWDSQFFHHMKSLATFDLGLSDATGEPVLDMFKRGAIPSLLITVPSFFLGWYLALTGALFLVLVRESWLDRAGIVLCVMQMSVPPMVYVILGQWLIAVEFAWLPAFGFDLSGCDTARFLALPVLTATLISLGGDIRMYRTVFLEEMHQDYMRTARAKGVSVWRILFVHVLKNGMISIITMVVATLPSLILGSLILENFFGIPGLGNLTMNAIRTSDFRVVMASVYLGSLLYLTGLLLTDVCYAVVDPRIRF